MFEEVLFTEVGFIQASQPGSGLKINCNGPDDELPPCEGCGSILLHYLTIPPELMRKAGFNWPEDFPVKLVGCWRCKAFFDMTYECTEEGVELLGFGYDPDDGPGPYTPFPDFPYSPYPDFFAARVVELEEIDPRDRQCCEYQLETEYATKTYELAAELGLNDFWVFPRLQIGGAPMLSHHPDVAECSVCENQLTFLATVPNNLGEGQGICGGDGVYTVFCICQECGAIQTSHQVD